MNEMNVSILNQYASVDSWSQVECVIWVGWVCGFSLKVLSLIVLICMKITIMTKQREIKQTFNDEKSNFHQLWTCETQCTTHSP